MCALSGHTDVISKAVLGRPHQKKPASHARLGTAPGGREEQTKEQL